MDIKEIGGSQLLTSVTQKKESGNSSEFLKILQEVSQSAGGAEKSSAAIGIEGSVQGFEMGTVNGIFEIQEIQPLQVQALSATESAMAVLEQYQQALADPSQTLKQIDPLVRSLSEKLTDLQGLAQRLSPADPLTGIVREVGTLSAVEIEKFNRGDYV